MIPRSIVLAFSLVSALAMLPAVAQAAEDPALPQLEFGVKMAQRGLWSEALFRFKQANDLSPGSPRTLNNIAVAYEALGQFDHALDYYQRAVARGGDAEMRKNYARFVEFYRNFKPEGEATEGEATEGMTAEGTAADGASADAGSR